MPNTREKLIDVLRMAHDAYYSKFDASKTYADVMADHLIAEGVTFATDNKWIPVSERLPDEEGWYLVFTTPNRGYRSINKGQFIKGYEWDNFKPRWRGAGGTWTNVTHWMPLPEPPKGE